MYSVDINEECYKRDGKQTGFQLNEIREYLPNIENHPHPDYNIFLLSHCTAKAWYNNHTDYLPCNVPIHHAYIEEFAGVRKALLKEVDCYDNIYIYGAGYNGKKLQKYLKRKGYDVSGYVPYPVFPSEILFHHFFSRFLLRPSLIYFQKSAVKYRGMWFQTTIMLRKPRSMENRFVGSRI